MKDTFFNSMVSEGGKISHKRWITVTVAAALVWAIVYGTLKAVNASERLAIIIATMAFILVMAGVATIPQLMAIWKGTTPPKDDEPKNDQL